MMMTRRTPLSLCFAVVVAACSSSTTPTGPARPAALSISSGAGQKDTVQATLPSPLIVTVTGTNIGHPVVQFIAVRPDTNSASGDSAEAYLLSDNAGGTLSLFVADTTDANGQARVPIELGTHAGLAHLIVRVPALSLVDTVTFTVQPGAPAHAVIAPHDSAVYINTRNVLRAAVTDRVGNPTSDPVTLTSTAVTVASLRSDTATAVTYGIAFIIAKFGVFADTARVTVIPTGILAAVNSINGLLMFDLDGSDMRTLAPFAAEDPRWAPSGMLIVYDRQTGAYSKSLLQTVDTLGNINQLGYDQGQGIPDYVGPKYSRDGQWVYFSNVNYDPEETSSLARLSTATGAITGVASNPVSSILWPSPSPDGTQLACEILNTLSIGVLDIATGALTTLPVTGQLPAWSPNSNVIAFLGSLGQIGLIASDGTGLRTVGANDVIYASVDWSPDGQWLVATNSTTGLLELINVSSNLVLPLDYSTGLTSATWRP